MNTTPESLGDRIKARRTALEISATELADRVGVTFQTVYRWESGEDVPKYPENMVALANGLEVHPCPLYFPEFYDGAAA